MKKPNCGIYKITNFVNNKVYIGQTINLRTRSSQHFSALKQNKHQNKHLQCSFNKHGIENFKYEIIEFCEPEKLNELEIFYIKKYNATNRNYGYNRENGGVLNRTLSEEARKEMSLRLKGKYAGEKNPNYGKHRSTETKQKISEALSHDIEPAIKDYINGMTITDSSHKHHVDFGKLSRILKERGIFRDNVIALEDAINDYNNGLGIVQCTKKYKIGYDKLINEIKNRNLFRNNDFTLPIELINDYKNGYSYQKLADKYNLSITYIRCRIIKNNLSRDYKKEYNDRLENAIKFYVENKESISLTSKKFHINENTLNSEIKKRNLYNGKRAQNVRKRISNKLKGHKMTDEIKVKLSKILTGRTLPLKTDINILINERLNGMSIKQICKKYHINNVTLKREFEKHNIYIDLRFKNKLYE